MIKGIVFDFGGVIVRLPIEEDMHDVLVESGLNFETLWDGWRKYRDPYDHGKFDCKEMYRRIMGDLNLPFDNALLARLEEYDMRSWTHANPDTLALMKKLKAEGFKIGILTNMARQFADMTFPVTFAEHTKTADALVISAHEDLIKPDPAIYDLMCKRIGLAPEELIFVDDLERNCIAACKCGWQAVQFTTVAEAEAKIRDIVNNCCV